MITVPYRCLLVLKRDVKLQLTMDVYFILYLLTYLPVDYAVEDMIPSGRPNKTWSEAAEKDC